MLRMKVWIRMETYSSGLGTFHKGQFQLCNTEL